MFLSEESNHELHGVIARGDLVALQKAVSEKRAHARDDARWLELSADLVKVFVQQSRYAEAKQIVDEIETKLGRPSMRRSRIVSLSVSLCVAHLLLPRRALCRFTAFLSRVAGFSGASTYVLDSVLWGIFWQDLWRARTYTVLMCFASRDDRERARAFSMLAYCLLIRGWESLGNWSLLRLLSETSRTPSKEYTDTYFWVGISNRWRSRPDQCLRYHASFETNFPEAEGFYRIISDSSRLQLAVAELGPAEVDFYYRKCRSETISMKHGRHQIHLKAARACLLGLKGRAQSSSVLLAEARQIADQVANTLDSLLLAWMSTIAFLNAGMLEEAEVTFREFSEAVERYGNPKLFRHEALRLSRILRFSRNPSGSVLLGCVAYLGGCLRLGSFHRLARGLRHAGAWLRDGQIAYWSKTGRLSYLSADSGEPENHEQFLSLFRSISEEFSTLATRSTDQSVNLDEVVTLVERTFGTKEIFVDGTLNNLIDRIQQRNILINSLARNEGSHSVRIPCNDGRIFIGVEEVHRQGNQSLAIGLLVKRSVFREESTDLIEFSLSFLMKYFFLMRDIRAAYQRDEESQRNRAIADTARMLAHDIRKPFSMLKAMIHTMSQISSWQEMSGFFERNLPELNRSIHSIEDMVADIIEFGKPAVFRASPISLHEMIDRSLSTVFALEPDTAVQLEYSLHITKKLHGEYSQCLRMISNIVGNAANALQHTRSPRIWFRAHETEDQRTEIVIGNNGPPIAPEDVPEIFQPFFTRNKKEGTGLGLAIAKKVVEAHGGRIECDSDENRTEFTFSLPTSSEAVTKCIPLPIQARSYSQRLAGKGTAAEPSMAENLSARFALHPGQVNLLVVDDEASYREAIRSLVRSDAQLAEKVRFFEAATFGEAVEFPGAPRFDVLVCDIDLKDPRGDGLDVVRRSRERFPSAEICVHSNRYLAGDSNRALAVGADSFFPKPMSHGHLVKLIQSWLEKNRTAPSAALPRVAIVDDDRVIRECWRIQLQGKFEVLRYETPEAFLEDAGNLRDLSAVVTDYQFRGAEGDVRNGAELAKRIRERDATLPVILSSGFDVENHGEFAAVFSKGDIPSVEALRKFLRRP